MKHHAAWLLFLPIVLIACPQAPKPEVLPPAVIVEQPFKPTLLGRLTVQLGGGVSSAKFVPSRLTTQTLSPITETDLVFTAQPSNVLDASSTQRFIVAPFNVTNSTATDLSNITLVAYKQNGNVGGSAFRNIQTFVGVPTPVDVNTLRPVHAMIGNVGVVVDNDNADLQIFKRSEIGTLTLASQGTLINNGVSGEGILDYGFIARKGSSGAYRTIPGTNCNPGANAGCNQGKVTLALRVPKDSDGGGSVYRYSMTFLIFSDNLRRVTESLEEQNTLNANTRATALGRGIEIATMCGTTQTTSTFIPGVRTVGVSADLAWMGGDFFDSNETLLDLAGIIGNTQKTYTGANGALNGRFVALGGATLSAATRDISTDTTLNGGNVGIAVNGDITIRPEVSSRAADEFTYRISDGTCTSPNITATIAAPSDMVWYIDSGAAAGGDGRSHTPFQSVSSLNVSALNTTAVNDFIYVKGSTGNSTLVLKNNQQLIGSGVALVVGAQTLQAAATSPTIGSSVTVAADNTISGLTMGGLTGSVGGTLTVSSASVVAGAAQAINLNGGTLAISLINVNSSGGVNGIALTNTQGTFAVTGVGTTPDSGGVLTGQTADGINLATQFGTVSLKNMRISNSANEGIETSPNTGTNLLHLEDMTINNVSTSLVSTHNAVLYNASGTSSNTVEVIGTIPVTSGNAASVASRIQEGDTSGMAVNTLVGSSATMVLRVEKTSFYKNASFGITTQFRSSGATTTTIDDNRMDLITIDGSGIRVDVDTPVQTHKLRIKNNTIDLVEGINNGASAGMDIRVRQAAMVQALIENNTVLDAESIGINMVAGSSPTSTANLQASVLNNVVSSNDPFAISGIFVQSGVSGGTGATVCLNAVTNASNFSDAASMNYTLRRISTGAGNTFGLHGAGATSTTASAVTNWLLGSPQSNTINDSGKVSVLGATVAPNYGTCTVVVPTF
jgi:trimeric autotransporter adhesin